MKYIFILSLFLIFGCKPDTATNSPNNGVQSENTQTTNNSKSSDKDYEQAKKIKEKLNKDNPYKPNRVRKEAVVKNPEAIAKVDNTLPDACKLLSLNSIASKLGINVNDINVKDGTSKRNQASRACFFKWDTGTIPNEGVMISIQSNPVADEVDNYITFLIDSKISQGEQDFVNDVNVKYKRWEEAGDAGAYSNELGKYMWRIGNEYAFMIAFNTPLEDAKKEKIAAAWAKEVTGNMGK